MESKKKVDKIISKLAYGQVIDNLESTCIWWFYQPKLPQKLETLKKKK